MIILDAAWHNFLYVSTESEIKAILSKLIRTLRNNSNNYATLNINNDKLKDKLNRNKVMIIKGNLFVVMDEIYYVSKVYDFLKMNKIENLTMIQLNVTLTI